MRTGVKILISLCASLAVFAGLFVLSANGYGSFIEANFYQPAVVRSLKTNLNLISSTAAAWHGKNREHFKDFLQSGFVKRAVLQEQSADDIKARDDAAYNLISAVPGLTGFRIIDADTLKIHYSTFPEDIVLHSDTLISYRRYEREKDDIPLQFISVPKDGAEKVTADSTNGLFLYCFPFYDNYQAYRGSAVFYVTAKSFLRKLIADKALTLSSDLSLMRDKNYNGFSILTGLSQFFSKELEAAVDTVWEQKPEEITLLSLENDKKNAQHWILLSIKTDFGYAGQICEKEFFTFSPIIKYFLMITAFITTFLIVFLGLNVRQDKFFIAQNKIQQLHLGILKNYIEDTQSKNWESLQKELEYRRHEVNAEIKHGIGKKILSKREKEIDAILQKSWEDIFAAINGKYSSAYAGAPDTAALIALLRQVIAKSEGKPLASAASGTAAPAVPAGMPAPAAPSKPAGQSDEGSLVEEIELADLGEFEEAALLEEDGLSAAPVSGKSAPKRTEAADAEEIEEIEEVEEIEEAEPLEEAEPVELLEADADTPGSAEKTETVYADTGKIIEEASSLEELDVLESDSAETALTEDAGQPAEGVPETASGSLEGAGGLMKQAAAFKTKTAKKSAKKEHKSLGGLMKAAKAKTAENDETFEPALEQKNNNPIDSLDDLIESAEEIIDVEPVEEVSALEDSAKTAEERISAAFEFNSNEDLEELNNMYLGNAEDKAFSDEDPLKAFDDMGFTVSGMDFSGLDSAENYIDKPDSCNMAAEVEYIEDLNLDFQKSMWGKYAEQPLQGELELSNKLKKSASSAANENIIITDEDGTFMVCKDNALEPKDKEFKALVDSVLK